MFSVYTTMAHSLTPKQVPRISFLLEILHRIPAKKQIAEGGSKRSKMAIYRFKFKLIPIYVNFPDIAYSAFSFRTLTFIYIEKEF